MRIPLLLAVALLSGCAEDQVSCRQQLEISRALDLECHQQLNAEIGKQRAFCGARP